MDFIAEYNRNFERAKADFAAAAARFSEDAARAIAKVSADFQRCSLLTQSEVDGLNATLAALRKLI